MARQPCDIHIKHRVTTVSAYCSSESINLPSLAAMFDLSSFVYVFVNKSAP